MRSSGTQVRASRVVHAPAGVLDRSSSAGLLAVLTAGHRPGVTVVLDLSRVTTLDSSALGAVLAAERLLTADGGGLHLVNAGRAVLRVLRISGLAERLAPQTVTASAAVAG